MKDPERHSLTWKYKLFAIEMKFKYESDFKWKWMCYNFLKMI